MSGKQEKYTMKMSLNVLNHLGLNLYSNIPAVLSEVVANAYDADAKKVEITLDVTNDKICIKDDGHGMNLEAINDKYLYVGYQKREDQPLSPKYDRPVMGRKGIGKLSLFSIANEVKVISAYADGNGNREVNGLSMNRLDIEKEIKSSQFYHPKDILDPKLDEPTGTTIILTNFKRKINYTEKHLRRRLAQRFSVIGKEHKFSVFINGIEITIADRDYLKKVQFLWSVGDVAESILDAHEYIEKKKVNGVIDGTNYKISGWIGSVEYPSDLNKDGTNNNKISVLCRGKLAQEDMLGSYNEGGIYADYLIGEIHADFLDTDDEDDIATSSRQKINEEDPRYRQLETVVYRILKEIQGEWTDLRNKYNEAEAKNKAISVDPVLGEWFDTLIGESSKEYARKLFGTIESFHFENNEDGRKQKIELYKNGIVAFEKLKLRHSLEKLKLLKNPEDVALVQVFADLNDIEANMYYDIAKERVEVIREFQKLVDSNDKEKVLQKYLFDNLWIINPSWERPTSGTELMEQRVESEFDTITRTLTEEEKKGRLDIKYRTATGKHIIVELKRYSPSYSLKPSELVDQLNKYSRALRKCLDNAGKVGEPIECILVLGEKLNDEDADFLTKMLGTIQGRVLYYDQLISESLEAYKDFIERQKKVGKLREVLDRLDSSV